MTKEQLIEWATAHGWTPDRYGHLQKTTVGLSGAKRHDRLKLSRIAARHETKLSFGWSRLQSGYYSALSITSEGKLAGMKY